VRVIFGTRHFCASFVLARARTLPYPSRMARISRVVAPGIAHHVTQRGNRRMPTFFDNDDYATYRALIAETCRQANVQVLAYCLMPNHVHLVLVPAAADGLRDALAEAHRAYSSLINRRKGWTGHLWQERFHSCPMDDAHTVAAVRYVELNPVRARMVPPPEAWPWCSAAAHILGQADELVSAMLPPPLDNLGPWDAYLAGVETDAATFDRLRSHQQTGRPLGCDAFVAAVEAQTKRSLTPRPVGRPRRVGGNSGQLDLWSGE
jgi:putative transposase